MDSILFLIALSCIFIHEMDAIRCREWRIFPGLSALNEAYSAPLFLVLHLPLLVWIFLELGAPDPTIFITRFEYFLILHLVLHLLFLFHPKNEFKDWLSWSFIVGAAAFSLLDLIF